MIERAGPIAIAAAVLLAGCNQPAPPQKSFMLVASGSPECLGSLARTMIDGGFGASESPVFSDPRLGTIRFGPVVQPRLAAAMATVKRTACASLARVEER